MKRQRQKKRFSNIFWKKTDSLFKERRQHKRFAATIPVNLKAKTASRTKVLDVKTKDISNAGAFIYTEDASYIPNDTLLILNFPDLDKRRITRKNIKRLENCTGTIVRSTSEGIAIRFTRPVELFV